MRFAPAPGEALHLLGEVFLVQPHPGASSMAYAAEGRRAFVYQVRDPRAGENLALKVFKPKFRDPDLVQVAQRLMQFRQLEGLKTAARRIVPPADPAALAWPELQHSMLMPWAQGKTWFDYLVHLRKERAHLEWVSALHLCERFLRVVEGLERAGIAHTDIAPGNVMIDPEGLGVQLIDLEDLYIPGLPTPAHRNTGSFGYRHRSADAGADLWCREGDRYAAGVLAAEILALSSPVLVELATDEGFFGGHCGEDLGRERYRQAESWLHAVAPEFSQRFAQTWYADQLTKCPPIIELRQAIALAAARHPQTSLTLKVIQPQPSTATWEKPSEPPPAQKKGKGCTCLLLSLLILLALASLPWVLDQLSGSRGVGCSPLLWLGLVIWIVVLIGKLRKKS